MSGTQLDISSKPMRSDAVRNRARVLDSARELLGRDGLEAQMDEIAASAGVGVGTVYRHFATKDALLQALAAVYFADLTAIAEQALEQNDPWQAFDGFIRSGAELLETNRALAQISADRPELMQSAAQDADASLGFFEKVDELISRAQSGGKLRADFELSDVPAIMCSLGALQISPKGYSNWRRVLEFVLDGLHGPGRSELPPVLLPVPRRDV
jgi:AcrR family transcriptional regulator